MNSVQIDDRTGLSVGEWFVSHVGKTRAEYKVDRAYMIEEVAAGRWTLKEAGSSLGEFATPIEAADALPKLEIDEWDSDNRALFFVRLAPQDFDEWISGETEMLYLKREGDAYWMTVPGRAGQDDYPTLLRGKIAGNEICRKSWETFNSNIIKSLKLDEAAWKVEIENGVLTATNLQDESLSLVAVEGSYSWSLFQGEVLSGTYRTVVEASEAAQKPTFSM